MNTSQLAILLEHMHNKFEINLTKIKDGCHSGRKVVTHYSKSDFPLVHRYLFNAWMWIYRQFKPETKARETTKFLMPYKAVQAETSVSSP